MTDQQRPVTPDHLVSALESAANLLRGATLDQRIPADTRAVFSSRASLIDELTEAWLEDSND